MVSLFVLEVLFFVITALLAKRKGRNPFLWGIAGACGIIVTLIGLAYFEDFKKLTEEQIKKSKVKEKIFSMKKDRKFFLNQLGN